jgi:ASCH domain
MKALTVRQPWASLLIAGVKDVENRTWSTGHRGRLAIHAGRPERQAFADEAWTLARKLRLDTPSGVVLGTVKVLDVVSDSRSDWASPGHYHWVVGDAKPYARPKRATGRLGIWTL